MIKTTQEPGRSSPSGHALRGHLERARHLKQEIDQVELTVRSNPQAADQEKMAVLKRMLKDELVQAKDLRSQAQGWRGATLAVEVGGSLTVPFLADLNAYVGGQVSGPDTGNSAVEGFVKASVGTTLGLSGGYAVGTERRSFYKGAGFLNIGYQTGNPIIGNSVGVRWPGLGSLSVNERGYGATLHLPGGCSLPGGFKLSAVASVDVEHPALERVNRPLFQAIDYCIERAHKDTEIVRRSLPGFLSRHFLCGPRQSPT